MRRTTSVTATPSSRRHTPVGGSLAYARASYRLRMFILVQLGLFVVLHFTIPSDSLLHLVTLLPALGLVLFVPVAVSSSMLKGSLIFGTGTFASFPFGGLSFLLVLDVAIAICLVVAGVWLVRYVRNAEHSLTEVRCALRLHMEGLRPTYWDRANMTRVGLYLTQVKREFVTRSIEAAPRGPAADLGAGSGKVLDILAGHATFVTATELDQTALENLRHRRQRLPNLEVVKADGESRSLPFPDNSLSLIVCLEAPAISEQDWFQRECNRVLMGGGVVVLSNTNRNSYKGLVSRLLRWYRTRQRKEWAKLYYRYSTRELLQRWTRAGFELRKQKGLFWLPVPNSSDTSMTSIGMLLDRMAPYLGCERWSPWMLVALAKRR